MHHTCAMVIPPWHSPGKYDYSPLEVETTMYPSTSQGNHFFLKPRCISNMKENVNIEHFGMHLVFLSSVRKVSRSVGMDN